MLIYLLIGALYALLAIRLGKVRAARRGDFVVVALVMVAWPMLLTYGVYSWNIRR